MDINKKCKLICKGCVSWGNCDMSFAKILKAMRQKRFVGCKDFIKYKRGKQ
jgi:hypothetical protein